MPLASPPMNTYDEMPYESHPYAQTHPSRLAVVARLFGLTPPAVETCRVLELASAAGLRGVAIEGGAALIVDLPRVVEAADRSGIFLFGFSPEDYPRG